MKTTALRGCAVLALCLLPRVSALTMTQTFGGAGSASSHNVETIYGFDLALDIPTFDPALGSLLSATLQIACYSTITCFEQNPLATPIVFSPHPLIDLSAALLPLTTNIVSPSASEGGSPAPTTTLLPGDSALVAVTSEVVLNWELTTGLDWFMGTNPALLLHTTSRRNVSWGVSWFDTTVAGAVTYNYTPQGVPERANTFMLFAAAMLCCAVHRRLGPPTPLRL